MLISVNPSGEAQATLAFLLDVDNTLLDNDRFSADLDETLSRAFGDEGRARYRAFYDARREHLGYADYLGALQDFRDGQDDQAALLQLSAFLLEYPFSQRLYPHALETLAHLRTLGLTVILSDGDIVFQPHKLRQSGLWDAVAGQALIYSHKPAHLEALQSRFHATHYVMVDDKPAILSDMKNRMGSRLTTVFVDEGHYAASAPPELKQAADLRIACIGDLRGIKLEGFMAGASPTISSRP